MNEPIVTVVMSHVLPVLGMERAALNLISELKDSQLRIVCAGESVNEVEGLAITVLGSPLRGFRRVVSIGRFRRWLKNDHRDDTVYVVVGVWAAVPFLIASLGLRTGPVIVWEHSLSSANVRSIWTLRILDLLARRLYGRAQAVVTVSDEVADRMERHGQRTATIGNIVEFEAPSGIRGARDPNLLAAVGSLNRTKNVSLALSALALLPAQIRLVVLGDGRERKKLETLASELGILDRVEFAGNVSREVVDSVMRQACVVVHPSLGETFGYVLLEASMRGVPVVAVDAPAMNTLVGTFVPGRLAKATPEAFARATLQELRSARDPDEWKLAAQRIRDDFGRESVVGQWRRAISIATEESPSPNVTREGRMSR